jgi:hypothetical protein
VDAHYHARCTHHYCFGILPLKLIVGIDVYLLAVVITTNDSEDEEIWAMSY